MRTTAALLGIVLSFQGAAIVDATGPASENTIDAEDLSARAELDGLQKQRGLTIVLFNEDGLGALQFKKRKFAFVRPFQDRYINSAAISHDGMQVAAFQLFTNAPSIVVVRADGTDLRRYLQPRYHYLVPICWSPDDRSVLVSSKDGFAVLDLKSNLLRQVPVQGTANPQCWSPDGKRIVYEAGSGGGDVSVYDLESGISTRIAEGNEPTWSPDVNRIAFRRGDTYYTVSPSGGPAIKLFHKRRAISALYWSPDSRFVAYVHQDYFALDVEFYHLMVRRLEDGDEDWVADGADAAAWWCQWVSNPSLLKLTVPAR